MCDVLDRVEKRGFANGEAIGEMKKAKATAFNLKEMGLTDEMFAKALNVSINLVRQWLGIAPAN